VTKENVAGYSPTLARKLALETSKMSIDSIADEIAVRCHRGSQRHIPSAITTVSRSPCGVSRATSYPSSWAMLTRGRPRSTPPSPRPS
jgi:hypothetical protein